MNIAFICDEYPPGKNGGIGSVVQNLARELVSQGNNVYVVGLYTNEYGCADYEEDLGVKVWRLRYDYYFPGNRLMKRAMRNLPKFLNSSLKTHKAYESFIFFLTKLIAQERIEIVEMPDWNTFIYEIGIHKPIPQLGIPLVVKFHCSRSYLSKELGQPIRKKWYDIDKAIFYRGDALAAVSQYTGQQTNKLFNENKNIKVLYNGIEIPTAVHSFQERDAGLVFYSGTLVKNKGVFSLMKAWNIVAQKFPGAQLIMFGKGDTQPLIKLLDKRASNTVIFKGHQPKAKLLEVLNIATLAVFPSYSETFGMGAVEAMSCACPTIFTKRSSGPEIITHNQSGLLVDPDNIDEIADNILLLLRDEAKRKQIGQQGKMEVEKKYALSTIASQHIDWYNEVIEQFNSRNQRNDS
ncbi:MAG: glycosyltransferase family 4 protein [Bacteroidota bacterium]